MFKNRFAPEIVFGSAHFHIPDSEPGLVPLICDVSSRAHATHAGLPEKAETGAWTGGTPLFKVLSDALLSG